MAMLTLWGALTLPDGNVLRGSFEETTRGEETILHAEVLQPDGSTVPRQLTRQDTEGGTVRWLTEAQTRAEMSAQAP